jgi:hypothetical protein
MGPTPNRARPFRGPARATRVLDISTSFVIGVAVVVRPRLSSRPFVRLPSTRYRGSKRRYADAIAQSMARTGAGRVCDPFGGSAVVSMVADALGIDSNFNDLHRWTAACARALLQHHYTRADLLALEDVIEVATSESGCGFVSEYFHGCYFTPSENLELDGLLRAFVHMRSERLRDLLFYGIAQACLAKLPMSMFHRACLPQRLAHVPRRSGNLGIWNTPFRALIPGYVEEALLYSWHRSANHRVSCGSALQAVRRITEGSVLFLDPPYLNPAGGVPTYSEAYHFLEGFVRGPSEWLAFLDGSGGHPIFRSPIQSGFEEPHLWKEGIAKLLDRVAGGAVLATARSLDRPGAPELSRLLRERFRRVRTQRLHKSTIFTARPNPEYLFYAA